MDPFVTLGQPPRFSIDVKQVEAIHRQLSRALHPDKFVGAGASERREALSKAVEVNEAWRIVRSPILRAEALFRRAGIEVGERAEPPASPSFLMDVMEMRESLIDLRESRDSAKLLDLCDAVRAREAASMRALAAGLDGESATKEDLVPLVRHLGELRFFRRLLDEASAIEEDWLSPKEGADSEPI